MQWNTLIDEAQTACETNDIQLAFGKLVEALAYLEKFPQGDVFLVETLRPLTEILWGNGDEALCLEYLVTLLQTEERLHGMGSLETNLSLTRLSELNFKRGRYIEAEAYGRKSFFILQKAIGDDCLDVAIAGHILAVLHQAAGNYESAEKMYKRSLSSLTRLRANSNEITSTLADYASLLRLLHRDEEAEHLIRCSASAA